MGLLIICLNGFLIECVYCDILLLNGLVVITCLLLICFCLRLWFTHLWHICFINVYSKNLFRYTFAWLDVGHWIFSTCDIISIIINIKGMAFKV
jgi:hypothetical protein